MDRLTRPSETSLPNRREQNLGKLRPFSRSSMKAALKDFSVTPSGSGPSILRVLMSTLLRSIISIPSLSKDGAVEEMETVVEEDMLAE